MPYPIGCYLTKPYVDGFELTSSGD